MPDILYSKKININYWNIQKTLTMEHQEPLKSNIIA